MKTQSLVSASLASWHLVMLLGLTIVGLASPSLPASGRGRLIRKNVTLGKGEYSPYLDQGYPDRVYFGDTICTRPIRRMPACSATGWVRKRLTDLHAARRSLRVQVSARSLQRPLDFLVVSDHSENLGLAPMIAESNPDLLKTEFGRKVHDLVKSGKGGNGL